MSHALIVFLALASPGIRPAELGGDWPAAPSGKTVTMEAKTANQALREIAGAASWGLALNSGPAGDAPVEFSFKAVPVEDAFAAVLYASKLHAVRIGDAVAVTPAVTPQDAAESDAPDTTAPALGPAAPFLNRKRHRHHSGNDRIQVGHDVEVGPGEKVGNVVAIGGSAHIGAGATTGDVVAIGGHIEADPGAQIGGDAVALGGDEHFGSGSTVAGDTVSLGGVVQLDSGATINGQQVNLHDMFGMAHPFWHPFWPQFAAGGLFVLFWVRKLAEFVLYFCLGALLLLAAPTQVATIEAFVMRQPLRAGLGGFLATLAIPILTVLLVVTLVGIPLVAVEIFAVALAAVMGFTAISVLIGNRLRIPVRGGGLLGLAIGTAIVVALTSLPLLGGVILVTGWFLALGAALATRYGSLHRV